MESMVVKDLYVGVPVVIGSTGIEKVEDIRIRCR